MANSGKGDLSETENSSRFDIRNPTLLKKLAIVVCVVLLGAGIIWLVSWIINEVDRDSSVSGGGGANTSGGVHASTSSSTPPPPPPGPAPPPPSPTPSCAPGSGLIQKDIELTEDRVNEGCSRIELETVCNNSFEKMDNDNYYMCQWDDTSPAPSSCTKQTEQCLPDLDAVTGIPYCSVGVWQPHHNLGAPPPPSPSNPLQYCHCRVGTTFQDHGSKNQSRCWR